MAAECWILTKVLDEHNLEVVFMDERESDVLEYLKTMKVTGDYYVMRATEAHHVTVNVDTHLKFIKE